ncbi:hypothetical protein OAA74_05080 [Flavobacteriaceae bacterium]|nr:hypothetical protein [Flavobacteriaceae bacterium]MDB9902963.1 hypothetical protein [Flavobacteriaceae bacterium]MDC1394467.1 hypothetical protein [Flavobacteriaceae bacterium]
MNYKYFLASFLFVFLSFNAVKAQAVISEKQAERALKKEQRQLKRIDRQYSDSIAYKAEYYQYMLLEDLDTRNFENLGWWQYQYNYYNSIIESAPENLTGKALIVDRFARNVMVLMVSMLKRVYEIEANRPAAIRDIPAVVFLLMLRTIVHPKDYVAYLAVISYSSKMEDYGTALFYVEALLENGYTDLDTLGALPETGLLRIMPEYQALLEVYLNKGLYGIREEDS